MFCVHWLPMWSPALPMCSVYMCSCALPMCSALPVCNVCSPNVQWSPLPGLSSPQAAGSWEVVTSVMGTQLCPDSRLVTCPACRSLLSDQERRWRHHHHTRGNKPPCHEARASSSGSVAGFTGYFIIIFFIYNFLSSQWYNDTGYNDLFSLLFYWLTFLNCWNDNCQLKHMRYGIWAWGHNQTNVRPTILHTYVEFYDDKMVSYYL